MSDRVAAPAILVKGVEKSYEDGRIRALIGMDLTVETGEWVSIIGPSDCGKSTLLHLIAALDRVDAGHIHVLGNDLDQLDDAGGERQRVAIARALANDPRVMLADEPTGSLDSSAGKRILELIARLRQQRELTVVMVTHDLSVAGRADRTISMLDGRLADAPTPTHTELSEVSIDVGV